MIRISIDGHIIGFIIIVPMDYLFSDKKIPQLISKETRALIEMIG